MFVWRTKNVWCLELIPAEHEAVTETVSDVQVESNRVSFKETMFPWKTRNVRLVKLIPAQPKDIVATVHDVIQEGFVRLNNTF